MFILVIVGAGLWTLLTLIIGIRVGASVAFFPWLTAPIGFFVIVLLARVYLEIITVLFRNRRQYIEATQAREIELWRVK